MIQTTQIDGDLNVGRNATLGGGARIAGNAVLGGNLKVEGWLDAANVKNPCKGLFMTFAKLNEAHPLPQNGWWALVGSSLPAQIFVADNRQWTDTGAQGGEPVVSAEYVNAAVCDDLAERCAALESALASMGADVRSAELAAQAAQNRADEAMCAASAADGKADDAIEDAALALQQINNHIASAQA